MVTKDNQTYHGDHFVMYKTIKLPCWAPGTNTMFQVNPTSKKKKKPTSTETNRKRDQICGYRPQGLRGQGTG